MTRYAENTSVSVDRSKAEVEKTLSRYGAAGFMYGWKDTCGGGREEIIAFEMNNRRIRFILPMPSRNDDEFWRTPGKGLKRSESQAYAKWEQACRQRWRALALVIKAKLEAVETAITEFEEEFLAHIVLPNNQTVGEFMIPQVALAYENKDMPPMLPLLKSKKERKGEKGTPHIVDVTVDEVTPGA